MFNKEKILQPRTVVHCRTEKQAVKLLTWADSIGLRWSRGDRYLDYNIWDKYEEDTCFYLYLGEYASLRFYKKEDYTILSFEDALLEESKENSITLDKAISITAQAFEGVYDKSGEPYILHCLQVMYNLKKYNDTELEIAGVLHDLVEDTDYHLSTHSYNGISTYYLTKGDLLGYIQISKRVYDILKLVTRTKGVSYQEEIDNICTNQDAIKVKMADLEHNSSVLRLKGIREKDLQRVAKYHKAYYQLKEALKD